MPSFREIAEPLAKMGVPMTPVRPGSKRAFLPDFPTTATTDLDQITVWDIQYPGHNAACVARAEDGGVWFWELDSPDVLERVLRDTGQDALYIPTFRVRSRDKRGHYYFRHNEASKQLGNISQTYVVGQDWSVRTNREYVVAPGSIHPDTGEPYKALDWNKPIIEAPQWLIDWLISQKIQKHSAPQVPGDAPRNDSGRVPHGSIHGYMLTQAGKLRQLGLTQDAIEVALLELVHANCEPPIDDTKVRTMAKSICNFPPGEDKSLVFNQASEVPQKIAEPEEEIDFESVEYPVFPKWVMHGTSIYEGFVKPYCEKNSRIDYFMWLPTAALMMNYLGTKINVPFKGWKPSFYLVFIGEKGNAHKSSSIKDGMKFLEYASVLQMYSKDVKNADGKTLVWEAGSPEGLGTDMTRTNCKNCVLFYDELSALVAKSRIEGSGMSGALLKMYESNNFSNSIKAKRDAFSVAPDSYCATLITATTDQRFTELWGMLAGDDTGLKDRFTFVLQPESLPEGSLESVVSYHEAALETRKLIDKAVNQKTFQFFDQTPFNVFLKEHKKEGRVEIRAEKWALYFAIDLGLTEIDEDCVERGIAMAKYELAVKSYLKTFEAKNEEANIQNNIMILLKKKKGVMVTRELERILSAGRFGTSMWRKALYGLALAGYIAEEGTGVKGNPHVVRMLRDMKIGAAE